MNLALFYDPLADPIEVQIERKKAEIKMVEANLASWLGFRPNKGDEASHAANADVYRSRIARLGKALDQLERRK